MEAGLDNNAVVPGVASRIVMFSQAVGVKKPL